MPNFLVSTTGSNVLLADLGTVVVHPTTDRDFFLEFTPFDIAESLDLEAAIQQENLTLKITTEEYGEYEIYPTEYFRGLSLQTQLSGKEEEKYITEKELESKDLTNLIDLEAENILITSSASVTRNIYLSSAALQKWKLAPKDKVFIVDSPASGVYTVESVTNQQNVIVKEPIPDSASIGTASFYHPIGAMRVGINSSDFLTTSGLYLQNLLVSIDSEIEQRLRTVNHKSIRGLIHFIDQGPASGFPSGCIKTTTGYPFPTKEEWKTPTEKLIVELNITRNPNNTPSIEEWKMYNLDGTVVLATVTDQITYSGVFEISRERTIS